MASRTIPGTLPWALITALLLWTAPAPARTVRTRLRRTSADVQVRLTPFDIPAQGETEVCQAIALPNRQPIDVDEIDFASPTGRGYISHHFALFVDDNDDLATLPHGPVQTLGCVGFGQNFGAILAGSQDPRARVPFPRGVGFTLEPHQIVLLDLHYINGSPEPLRVDGAVNLHRARKGSIRHHAHAFQFGTFNIDVPPAQDGSAGAQWIAPFPMNVVYLSTHSHKHTTSVDLDVVRSGRDVGQVLQTLDYQHPTFHTYTPPMRLIPGDGLRWTCTYHNGTANTLTFGPTSNDEMCFAMGAFYLDDDSAPLPSVPGCLGGNVALTCPGL